MGFCMWISGVCSGREWWQRVLARDCEPAQLEQHCRVQNQDHQPFAVRCEAANANTTHWRKHHCERCDFACWHDAALSRLVGVLRFPSVAPDDTTSLRVALSHSVALLRNEATEALLRGEVVVTDDRFLIQSAPVDESDMSTQNNPKGLKELWTTTKWKKKTRNKLITARFFVKTEVSDDSESDDSDSDDSDSDDARAKAKTRVNDRAHLPRNRDGAGTDGGGGGASLADRSRSASVMSKQARARVGAEALSRQGPRGVSSAAPMLGSGAAALSTNELSLSISSAAPAGAQPSPLNSSTEGASPTFLPLSDRGIHFPWRAGELLGRGTSGHVYKAMRADTGEMIAMKVGSLQGTLWWCHVRICVFV